MCGVIVGNKKGGFFEAALFVCQPCTLLAAILNCSLESDATLLVQRLDQQQERGRQRGI
jgi:hypothetical protein